MTENYKIRTMKRNEIDLTVDWAASEGWNPGLRDAESFFIQDSEGFLIGELNGKPIATISVVKYCSTFAFLGFYIVKPEFRGMGYGLKIWNAGMNSLIGRNVGLDGVVDQQKNYKKSGFSLAYNNIRFEGSGFPEKSHSSIVQLNTIPFDYINHYDQLMFPEKRSEFLKNWISQEGHQSLGIMVKDKLAGFGVIRPCRTGFKIGPLYADSAEYAESLFLALNTFAGNSPVFLDTPETNVQAVKLAEKYSMTKVFETARMYTGQFPDIPIDKLFGVTTFELG